VPFLPVTLDEACRKQQLKEEWFSTFEEVAKQAIRVSIMNSLAIITSAPDKK